MGFFSSLGQKLRSVQSIGSKMLKGAGSLGQKFSAGANKFLDHIETIPVAGQMVQKLPMYQTMRGAVSGAGSLGRLASVAGQALEKPITSVAQAAKTYKGLKNVGKMAASEVAGISNSYKGAGAQDGTPLANQK
jgi:hypothetical protein